MPTPLKSFSPAGPAVAIPALCVGLAVLAACVLLPAVQENHRLADERAALASDLAAVGRQSAANEAFLSRVGRDAELDDRLAARRTRARQPGSEAVPDPAGAADEFGGSPFALMAVAAPADPTPARQPDWAVAWAVHPAVRGWVLGGGLFLVAFGLVMGGVDIRPESADDPPDE